MRARPHLVEGRPSRRGYWQDVVSRSLVTASSLLQLEATNHFFSLSPSLPRSCAYIRLCKWVNVPKRILPRQCNNVNHAYAFALNDGEGTADGPWWTASSFILVLFCAKFANKSKVEVCNEVSWVRNNCRFFPSLFPLLRRINPNKE